MVGLIFFTERNARGAYVIHGVNGTRQYYGYTKKEAERRYRELAKLEVVQFWNQSRKPDGRKGVGQT